MDLEKAYNRVDREALWKVLRLYGVGGQLLKGIQAFYREANACVRVGGKFSESFAVEVGVRQGCVKGGVGGAVEDGVVDAVEGGVGSIIDFFLIYLFIYFLRIHTHIA